MTNRQEALERARIAKDRRDEAMRYVATRTEELRVAVCAALEDGWSMADVARHLGVSRQRVDQIKRGTR